DLGDELDRFTLGALERADLALESERPLEASHRRSPGGEAWATQARAGLVIDTSVLVRLGLGGGAVVLSCGPAGVVELLEQRLRRLRPAWRRTRGRVDALV